ncbi:hypothetical protein [Sphingomonas lenta]|uniref:Uncharacterized protein n=1 Tax=Sphingomonas lenta TaxID=1141887 RepID=A0A2A2SFP9_9SPHN|nr:hypothetical protein [Sphingomonas lenta]PAX08077.1 hypothetical protein CKY28_10835 [Sphingomonas lenta]
MIRILLATTAAALAASPAPASKKPCRDAQGRVVECPKPKASPSSRCKDERGRFVKCGTPGARPATNS